MITTMTTIRVITTITMIASEAIAVAAARAAAALPAVIDDTMTVMMTVIGALSSSRDSRPAGARPRAVL